MMYNVLIAGPSFLIFLICLWVIYCNYRTYYEKKKILDSLEPFCGKPEFRHLLELSRYDVSYYNHLYARVFFRNWKKLYSEEVKQAMPEAFR